MKKVIIFFMICGFYIGSYLPTIWGENIFSGSSMLFSAIGGFVGIWIGYKIAIKIGY